MKGKTVFYKIDFSTEELIAKRISQHNYYSRVPYYNTHDTDHVFDDGTVATVAWENNILYIEGESLVESNFEELREIYRYYAE